MRWLLVGTAPPPGGAGALALARRAQVLAAAGNEVVILSGDLRSAAQRHARLEGCGLLGANLVWYGRRFDALELCVESTILGGLTGPASRTSVAVLRFALGRFSSVRLRLEHPLDARVLSARFCALLMSATEVVVSNEVDLAAVAAATGRAVVCETKPLPRSDSSALAVLLGGAREAPPRRMLPMLVYERVRILGVLALRRALRR